LRSEYQDWQSLTDDSSSERGKRQRGNMIVYG